MTGRGLFKPDEVRIIAGLARGHTRRRIAADLGAPEGTVSNRLLRLGRRLGARGSIQPVLVDYGYAYGYLAGLEAERTGQVPLSSRQEAVLVMTARGCSALRMAAALDVSLDTVREHRRRLYWALGAQTRGHAVALGWQAGILHHQPGKRVAPAPAEDRRLVAVDIAHHRHLVGGSA